MTPARLIAMIGVAGVIACAILLPQQVDHEGFAETKIIETHTADILFVGDMFFDRHIRRVIEREGFDFLFSCATTSFAKADLVVGNLEGPITDNASVSRGTTQDTLDHFRFTFPSATAAALKRNGVDVVNLGNNHIGNFGVSGITATHEYLREAGIGFFGGIEGDEPVLRREVNGIPISFISYNQFGGDTPNTVAEKIREEKNAGRKPLIYTHWGDEYLPATDGMKDTARLFAEAGASAVIGSHPHVILPSEYIGEMLVYYSLGNFIFDQYWNDDVSHGRAIVLTISDADDSVSATDLDAVIHPEGYTCIENADPSIETR